MSTPSEADILSRFAAVIRQVGSVAAIVIGAIPQLGLPNAVRAPLIAVGGLILAIEHALGSSAVPITQAEVPPKAPPGPA